MLVSQNPTHLTPRWYKCDLLGPAGSDSDALPKHDHSVTTGRDHLSYDIHHKLFHTIGPSPKCTQIEKRIATPCRRRGLAVSVLPPHTPPTRSGMQR